MTINSWLALLLGCYKYLNNTPLRWMYCNKKTPISFREKRGLVSQSMFPSSMLIRDGSFNCVFYFDDMFIIIPI